jgi:hypothetical protein
MPALATIVATLTAVTWSYFALARGSFWRLKGASVRASDKSGFPGYVVAVVPARDETELIGSVFVSHVPRLTLLNGQFPTSIVKLSSRPNPNEYPV